MKEYNRKAAVEYAQKWALSANPKYYHYGKDGGDCTNFVSQCLLAGGAVMNYDKYYGWFYIDANNHSPSWTDVKYIERFLLRENGKGIKAKLASLDQLEEGDLIQLRQNPTRFNHTLIISKIERGRIFVCAHTNDALDRPLDDYKFLEYKCLKILGIEE